MFDAWTLAGVAGGSAVLTYLATSGWREQSGQTSMRLSLDKGHSLVGDVRFLGGALTAVASMYVKSSGTKHALQAVSAASFLSLIQTEVVRWKVAKDKKQIAGPLPVFPSFSNPVFGGVQQPAWARSK